MQTDYLYLMLLHLFLSVKRYFLFIFSILFVLCWCVQCFWFICHIYSHIDSWVIVVCILLYRLICIEWFTRQERKGSNYMSSNYGIYSFLFNQYEIGISIKTNLIYFLTFSVVIILQKKVEKEKSWKFVYSSFVTDNFSLCLCSFPKGLTLEFNASFCVYIHISLIF